MVSLSALAHGRGAVRAATIVIPGDARKRVNSESVYID